MAKDNILIFRRREVKYILTEEQYTALKERIAPFISADDYCRYTICNIYFDNEDDTLIRTSLQKPAFKQKLRVRSYGIPSDSEKVFLEIKKKYKHIVYKRRIRITYRQYKDYIINGITPDGYEYDRTFLEIDHFIKEYGLKPKVYLAYDREAYFTTENSDFRITFDKNIRFRYQNPDFAGGDIGELLQYEGKYILELKAGDAIPLWLVKILNELRIYKSSFSKYGKVYETNIQKSIQTKNYTIVNGVSTVEMHMAAAVGK